MDKKHLPLHSVHVDKLSVAINRTHILLHSFFLFIFLSYRLSLLFLILTGNDAVSRPLLPCLILFLAELLLSLHWLFEQGFRWRPVRRSVFVDRLPEETHLPAVDVLVCTADPNREPTMDVMNTVVSAMALDYPAGKLHVYLSDDGGAAVTLRAVKEAWAFATWWVPFCRRYGVDCRCPALYFDGERRNPLEDDGDFVRDRLQLQEKYEMFKERIETNLRQGMGETDKESKADHPPLVQVVNGNYVDPSIFNPDHTDIPMLVYVAREKRPSHHHHFKAGALNALLRVSGILSNSPIVLPLDCDMYCADPTTAKQAMCYYLDQEVSQSLAFVQFPQRYRNLSKNDLYDTGVRFGFEIVSPGLDGLMGPNMCGTGLYINRKAMYSGSMKGSDLMELRSDFGPSNELIKTLSEDVKPEAIKSGDISNEVVKEAEFVATCTYEKDTKWGNGVGFFYYSLIEDVFTSYNLHCSGWKSVYLNPKKAPFLGVTTTNLNDVFTQHSRWFAGCLEYGLSHFCPLVYPPARRQLSLVACICYSWMALHPLIFFISGWCLAVIPQLFLLYGIPLYPKVSSSLFPVLAFIFFSSLLKHLYEVLTTRGNVVSWWNEQRMWMVKVLTCFTYGSIEVIMKIIGLKNTSFIPTNKFIDEEQEKRYQQGIFDFQASSAFLVPLGVPVILNLMCLVGGLMRLIVWGSWDEMAAQVIFSGFLLVVSMPVLEGMTVRKDRARFRTSATLMSLAVCLMVLLFGPVVLLH